MFAFLKPTLLLLRTRATLSTSFCVTALFVAASVASPLCAVEQSKAKKFATDKEFKSRVLPLIEKYCLDCHGEDGAEGDVSFHGLSESGQVLRNREIWEKALRMMSSDMMPPKDHDDRPTEAERNSVATWLELKLYHVDCDVVDDAGQVTIHRLNRTEYNNTVRDLLGVDIDPAKDFPSDDVGYGFSNIADVLSLPPLLFEKYVDASERIASAAIMTDKSGRGRQRFEAAKLKGGGAGQVRGEWMQMSSTGSAIHRHDVQADGEYIIRVEAAADQAGGELARMEIRVDGKSITTHDVKGQRQPATYEVNLKLSKGSRVIEAAFVNDYYNPKAKNPKDRDRNLAVRYIEIQGPTDAPPPEVHQRLVFVTPSEKKSVEQAAREILNRLMPRAFRRPVDDVEVDRLVKVVEFVVDRGDSFEKGIQVALQGILVSPNFLFRVEQEPPSGQTQHALNDYELASRLSYFLWSSMPDATLFEIAAQGRLHEPKVLDEQVTRMLADPKSQALVDNFASQWLTLSNIVEATPDKKLFPEFTPELRADMVAETKAVIAEIFTNDRSLLDFLDANYTFVNERLAKHYQISGVQGAEMRRVSLPSNQRAGVLTHGSILTITSNPDRTSLVRRGAWILDNILGVQLPDPPADVPSLEEGAKKSGATSLRDQLRIHRESPACASCHDTLDPLGFGFENFDPIGRWRTKAEGVEVDSGGKLPSGESFKGPTELVVILKKRKDEFAKLLTRKMLTYGLGRGLTLPDTCTVDEIVADLKKNDYRFSVLVRGIVHSKPFLIRKTSNE